VASISGFSHLSFTVTDRERSVAWYEAVLGFTRHSEVEAATFRRTRMRHPDGGVMVTLTQHDAGSGDRFDETRTGIDHLSFAVPDLDDLKDWKRRFEEHDVDHTEIKETGPQSGMITFRDPDNIQLEVFALRPEAQR
jgi:glyoxylase I family protein